jgi:hypothetical protein
MPISQQIASVAGFVTSVVAVAGVAVMVREAGIAVMPHSIPWEAKQPLIEKYGKWAVNRAEAFCPENDVACVEREAKRLFEVITHRRES